MPMASAEIRRAYLQYFQEHGHTIVPSSPLVPANDPTLLFTNAGMVQFKTVFLGLEQRPYKRATTAQKCLRVSGKHNDLENVGPSPIHHTFFEMLGNFSFGDYFKRQAISLAWDFLLNVLHLDRERLYFTVYREDDESRSLWQEIAGVGPERVFSMGAKTNFWTMGDTGPCGPNTEIFYDRGPEFCTCGQPDCSPQLDNGCQRWPEIWNLVFMQYNMDKDGSLSELPAKGVDTGMGLERVTAIMQGARTNYDTDVFLPLLDEVQRLAGHTEEQRQQGIVSYRVIADHARAVTFLIGDGVLPGNEGRNYVLRMILRRAVRFGRKIGFTRPFMDEVAKVVIERMSHVFPELEKRREFILTTIRQEELRFLKTLDAGLARLDEVIAAVEERGERMIPGRDAFRLYDTFGIPMEIIRDVAEEHGLTVDEAGFHAAMEEQRARARAADMFEEIDEESLRVYRDLLEGLQKKGLLGPEGVLHDPYEATELETTVAAILRGGKSVQAARVGDKVEVVLSETCFYVESGGQVSDTGYIAAFPSEEAEEPVWEIRVDDMRRPVPGLIVHIGEVTLGTPRVGERAWALVDYERRMDIARNHTATHLLHNELRYVLGEHVQQAGSLVAPDRLRFDFTHGAMLTQDEIDRVVRGVNEAILANYPVIWEYKPYREALSEGVIALFGEKYGEVVRVLRIGWPDEPFSQELCGGTHVDETGEIGFFYIISEQGIGAGVRRIEAVTGRGAVEWIQKHMRSLESIAAHLLCSPEEVNRKVLELQDELQTARKEIARLQRQLARYQLEDLLDQVQEVAGVPLLVARVNVPDMETLREMTDWYRERVRSGVVVLGTVLEGRPAFVAAVTPDLARQGVDAVQLVRGVAQVVGGGGGGRPTLAQAGGKDARRLDEALRRAPQLLREALGRA